MARSAESVDEISLLVRTPGNLKGYRAFTEAEWSEAVAYARDQGVDVEELP